MKIIKSNYLSICLFFSFIIYFTFWYLFNSGNIINNNNSLTKAIELYDFNPYLSYLFFKISESLNLTEILGVIIFPSLVVVLIYKIFFKFLQSRLWALSIALLSITGNENYPFINFFLEFIQFGEISSFVNSKENFEIIGFPIPSLSIFYFSLLFYFSIRTYKLTRKKYFILTFFWGMGPLIHPLDGIICLLFWNFFLFVKYKLKVIKFKKDFIIFFIFINILVTVYIFNQINLETIILADDQNFSLYNLFFYFIIPLTLIFICLFYIKIDKYEFYQKFLGIYLFMIIEFFLIVLSINGTGVSLQILETRLSMFLLHFLYYLPIIYYLRQDTYFLLASSNTSPTKKYILNYLYFLFFKLNKLYLPIFSILLVIYLILSLKL